VKVLLSKHIAAVAKVGERMVHVGRSSCWLLRQRGCPVGYHMLCYSAMRAAHVVQGLLRA
jgi:hypothetical protein